MNHVAAAEAVDRQAIHRELERVRADFHQLLECANEEQLRRRTEATRWTNEQLLFHMLFGYLVVSVLLGLTRFFGRLPHRVSRGYARLLDAAIGPFDLVNYLGSRVGARVYGRARMGAKLDRVIASLHRRLDRENPRDLARGMHYPTRWDPFFADYMTLGELYRYPTLHYDFHRRQLTLTPRC